MSRVLIAGFGYLGSRLAPELVGAGHEVFGLSRRPTKSRGIVAVEADLVEPSSLRALPPRLDAVVYMASADGRSDESYRDAYVSGPRNLLAALEERGDAIRRVLFVSSTGVYEQTDGSWVDESSETGSSGFSARRLLEGERVVESARFDSVVLRLSGIYGPGRAYWLDRVLAGEETFAVGPGELSNLIHVEDAARALAHLLALDRPDPVYVGSDSAPVEKRELLRWIAHELSLGAPRFTGGKGRGNKRCSNRRLLATGFRLRYPTFREGYRSLMSTLEES